MSNCPLAQPLSISRAASSGLIKAGMVNWFCAVSGVATKPGLTTLTPIPWSCKSKYSVSAKWVRAVGQAVGQTAPTRHTAEQTDVAPSLSEHAGQHRIDDLQRALVVDFVVLEHLCQIHSAGALGLVVTCGIDHHVERAFDQQGLGRGLHLGSVAHIERAPLHASILLGPLRHALWVAR